MSVTNTYLNPPACALVKMLLTPVNAAWLYSSSEQAVVALAHSQVGLVASLRAQRQGDGTVVEAS